MLILIVNVILIDYSYTKSDRHSQCHSDTDSGYICWCEFYNL